MDTKDPILQFLGYKLNTESARERHALRNLLERFYEKDTNAITALLTDSLISPNRRVVAMAADVCGRKKINPSLPVLGKLLHDTTWNIRQMAARNIGKIGDIQWADSLKTLLKDPHTYVRMRAAYGLGYILPENILDYISDIVDQKEIVIRNNFILGMVKREKKVSMKFVVNAIDQSNTITGKKTVTLLVPYTEESKTSIKWYKKLVKKLPFEVRKSLYLSIMGSGNEFWISNARKYSRLEPDKYLKNLIQN